MLIPVPYQFFGARCAGRRARRAPGGRERGVYDFIYGVGLLVAGSVLTVQVTLTAGEPVRAAVLPPVGILRWGVPRTVRFEVRCATTFYRFYHHAHAARSQTPGLIEEVSQGHLCWHLVPVGRVERRAKHARLVAKPSPDGE